MNDSRIAPWINRAVLLAAGGVFTLIAARYIVDPARASAASGVALRSALGATTTRIGFGAFPLGFAVFSFSGLVSPRRRRAAVTLVATVVSSAIVVRLFSLAVDGLERESIKLFAPELAILALAIAGLLLDSARRGRETGGRA